MNTQNEQCDARYLLLATGVILLGLAGYIGYVLYPRFDLPAVSGAGLLLLAAGAGIGSFFSPCSFPLLATLLARSIDTDKKPSALSRAVQFGGSLALGTSLFLLLVGAGIALGAGAIFSQVTFTSTAGRTVRIVIGLLLILFGLTQTEIIALPFGKVAELGHRIQKRQASLRREHPVFAFGLLGFGYILAGFG